MCVCVCGGGERQLGAQGGRSAAARLVGCKRPCSSCAPLAALCLTCRLRKCCLHQPSAVPAITTTTPSSCRLAIDRLDDENAQFLGNYQADVEQLAQVGDWAGEGLIISGGGVC